MITQHLGVRLPITAMLLSFALAGAAGCSRESPSEQSGPSVDESVLLALDYYEPIYRLDAAGRVINLKLDGKILPDAVFAEIGKLTELWEISIAGASFDEESLAHLQNLPYLRNLGIGATAITDTTLGHLEKLESLRQVWMPRARLSEEAIQKLKDARPGLTVHLY
jgi:hypothetical protein